MTPLDDTLAFIDNWPDVPPPTRRERLRRRLRRWNTRMGWLAILDTVFVVGLVVAGVGILLAGHWDVAIAPVLAAALRVFTLSNRQAPDIQLVPAHDIDWGADTISVVLLDTYQPTPNDGATLRWEHGGQRVFDLDRDS